VAATLESIDEEPDGRGGTGEKLVVVDRALDRSGESLCLIFRNRQGLLLADHAGKRCGVDLDDGLLPDSGG
jgi:hypothetical protein